MLDKLTHAHGLWLLGSTVCWAQATCEALYAHVPAMLCCVAQAPCATMVRHPVRVQADAYSAGFVNASTEICSPQVQSAIRICASSFEPSSASHRGYRPSRLGLQPLRHLAPSVTAPVPSTARCPALTWDKRRACATHGRARCASRVAQTQTARA